MLEVFISAAILLAVVFVCWLVNNVSTGSSGGTCDIVFQDNTKFLLNVGVRALKNDPDGGFVKIWYSGGDCEIQINFEETQLLRHVDSWGSPESYMKSMYGITADEYRKFQGMVKMDVNKIDDHSDQICFYYKYGSGGNGVARKKWLIEHIEENYTQHKMVEYSDSICLFVDGKF